MSDDRIIRIFIGYDSHETVAWHVLTHSILARASRPVSFVPLNLKNLGPLMWRERNPLQSTEFSFSRFLTPYLSGYEGWSLFMDCDMLVQEDIAKLWDLRDERYSAMCVKHDHQPKESVKFLDQPQTAYAKKNWSSVMLFNNPRCKVLTPEYVNTASGLELHQFKWLESDTLIGCVADTWNHLVGYQPPQNDVAVLHFTLGGPYFHDYVDCDHAENWRTEQALMNRADRR
jgi:lipopolysaccharide biosynthesis glycosyltransferase